MDRENKRGAFLEEVGREITELCNKHGIGSQYGEFKEDLLQVMAKQLKASFANGIKVGKKGRETRAKENRE